MPTDDVWSVFPVAMVLLTPRKKGRLSISGLFDSFFIF